MFTMYTVLCVCLTGRGTIAGGAEMTQLYNVIRAVCGRVETYRATTGLHYLGNMDFLFPPTLS